MRWSELTCICPLTPKHIVVGGYNGGLWYTRDGGETWFPAVYDLPSNRDRDAVHIRAIARHGERVFAVGWQGTLLCSEDGGRQWTFIDTGAKNRDDFCGLYVDPRGSTLLLASGARQAVILSSSDGKKWARYEHDATADDISAASCEEIYLMHDGDQVSRSTDGGKTFIKIFAMPAQPGPYRGLIRSLAVLEPGRLLVAGSAPITKKTPGSMPGQMFIETTGTKSLVFEIRNGGADVQPVEMPIHAQWEAMITPSLEEWILLSKEGIIARTTDAGRTWKRHDVPPPTQSRYLRVLGAVGQTIFAAGQSAFFRSDDECATWKHLHNHTPQSIRHTVETSWGEVIGLGSRVVRRVGTSNLDWEAIAGLDHARTLVEVEPNVLLALAGCAIVRSADRGHTWTEVLPADKPYLTNLAALGGGAAIAVGERGVIVMSTDGGRTWSPRKNAKRKNLAAVWGQQTFIVAVGSSGTILHSEDGGDTFEVADVPAKTPGLDEVTATESSVLVALARGEKLILRSTDFGRAWRKHSGLFPDWVHGLVTLPDGRVAVAGSDSAVYVSQNGIDWKRVQVPQNDAVLSVTGLSSGKALITTDSGVVWEISLPPP